MPRSLPRAASLLAALLLFPAAAAPAGGAVTLATPDGAITVSGTLLGFDGAFYRVQSIYGALTLDAAEVVCTGPGCPDAGSFVEELRIDGDALLALRLLPALLSAFAGARGWSAVTEGATLGLADADGRLRARFDIAAQGGDAGLLALLTGEADVSLGFDVLRDAGVHARLLGLEALVPVTGAGNPVGGIGLDALEGVLSGRIASWEALGGPETPIALHALAEASALQQALEALLLGQQGLPFAASARRHADVASLLAAVAEDPQALALVPASAAGGASRLALHDGCGRGLPATAEAVKAGDYPLVVPMVLHVRAERLSPVLRALLGWLSGPDVQATVRDTGFVDRAAAGLGPAPDAEGPAPGDVRLTPTFRFEAGTAELDFAARAAIALLAREIAAGLHDGRTLVLAGHTDSTGTAAANLRLSEARAQAVREAIAVAAPEAAGRGVTLLAEGFGPARPLVCDESGWAGRLNRRVELWLR